MRKALIIAIIARLCSKPVYAVHPLVDVENTRFLGTALPNGVTQWLGMRYASPPLGNLRFRAPIDPPVNDAIQVADTHGPICLAMGTTYSDALEDGQSEDCLFLDVYAPSKATAKSKLPVFFWIQGGGFNFNNNANYNGSELIMAADMDMVIVTHNYRASLYGFLAGKEVLTNGNLNVGLLDQRKALEWVQKHISKFGGNPGHVVLGGDSAGARSIMYHLTAYSGAPTNLFHAVTAESASYPPILTVEGAQFKYDALVERVGCATSTDSLECLRALDISKLQNDNIAIPFPGRNNPSEGYAPTLDGSLVPNSTIRLLMEGKFVKVPSMFGDATDDGTYFTPPNANSTEDMDNFFLDRFPNLSASNLETIHHLYPESEQIPNHGAYFSATAKAYGEFQYVCPGIHISDLIRGFRRSLSNWLWRYNVLDPEQAAAGLGVPHTVEVFAIWGPNSTTDGIPGKPASLLTTNAPIIPVIQGYWTSFIRSFDPNTYRAVGTPEWVPFDGKRRLLFETNATRMESVSMGQQERCNQLTSIASALNQV